MPYEIWGLLHIGSVGIQMKRVLVGNRLRPQAGLGFQMRGDNPIGRPLIGRDENCVKGTGKITFF